MNTKESVSLLLLAYCEATNLRNAYAGACRALETAEISDYEILILTNPRPDGSDDGTPDIADELAAKERNVRHIGSARYASIGNKYRDGVQAATKKYVIWVPGDNETEESSLTDIFRHIGRADIIAVYTENPQVRAPKRRIASRGFVILCNLLFGLHMKYYNGPCVIRRDLALAAPMSTDSFAFMAEMLIYLIKSGVRYIQVPMRIRPATNISSSFRFKSIFECLGLLARLFWKINILKQGASATIIAREKERPRSADYKN